MCKALFFLLFVGLLVCLLVAVFCHGLVVFVVLGAKMGVVVCLVGVFLVVLARFEMSLHILDF